MQVIKHMKCILETMRPHFTQNRIFHLFESHLMSNLQMPGRHTISNVICFKGDDGRDWSRDYRLFSTSQWDAKKCMNSVLLEGLKQLPQTSRISIIVDLTTLRKHGKRIPFTNYQVDPLSPPFSRGLMWGQRFLHASLLIPMHEHSLPARSIPVRLEVSPYVKKPGKKGTEEQWRAYRAECKKRNANTHTMNLVKEVRDVCMSYTDKKVLIVGDGGFCNKHCFKSLPEEVDLLVRCRKDAKLCYKSEGKSFYGSEKFSPEDVRKSLNRPWENARAYYGGDWREIQYKEDLKVYWERGAQRRQLRLIVIKPIPYRKTGSGYENYRDSCYLLTTDLTSDAGELLQTYFNRIEIEQNHRDMKNSLGLGQAQVWSEKASEKHPQLIALAYSVLLLATLRACGPRREEKDYLPPPKWYRGRKRPTIEDMRRRIRQEFIQYPHWREEFGIHVPWDQTTSKLVA